MRIFRDDDPLPADARGAVVAIGNFDGVHRGHRLVIDETRRLAAALGAPSAVLTFEPHPRRLFAPEAPPFRLASLDAKARLLEELGLDLLLVRKFDRAFAAITADDFISRVLVDELAVGQIVVGEDFAFGHRRQGTVALLKERGAALGFTVTSAPQLRDDSGAVISSRTIRAALRSGDTATAQALLGRPWEIEGEVVRGDARGRDLGFPTANVDMDDYLRPAHGIYAVHAGIVEGARTEWHQGAASFGLRPQFGGADERLEVYLIDYEGELYGRRLRVAFHGFLRGERKFDDIDGLIAQMTRDVAEARALLATKPAP